jgi:hypothetical protein
MNKKFKRPKNHERIFIDYDPYYLRPDDKAGLVYKDTTTLRKTRNLFVLYDEVCENGIDSLNQEKFCKERGIKKLSYLRLLALVKKFLKLDGDGGVSVEDTATNKKYATLLAMYQDLIDNQLDMKLFCNENHISRTTFFRYINVIENYLYHEDENDRYRNRAIAFDEFGNYCLIDSV